MRFFKRLRELEVGMALHARDHQWTKLLEDLDARVKALEKLAVQRLRDQTMEELEKRPSDATGKYL
jgi:hypothetical protein